MLKFKTMTPYFRSKDILDLAHYHLTYSHPNQVIKAIEEFSELTTKLCKYLLQKYAREPLDEDQVLSEIFDADFMLFQIKLVFINSTDRQDLYDRIVDEKLDRELRRWGLVT